MMLKGISDITFFLLTTDEEKDMVLFQGTQDSPQNVIVGGKKTKTGYIR